MRIFTQLTLSLCVLLASLCASPLHAAAAADKTPHPDTDPEILRTSAGTVEVGTISGVSYRIDVPRAWNHSLVVFYHGYLEGRIVHTPSAPLDSRIQPIFDRGYAIIQSAFSAPGWALAEGFPETEKLRLYFLHQYTKSAPNIETLVAGISMGGTLVAATLELNPRPYAGGLDLCGSVGSTDVSFQRRFAFRAAFDFFFPNLMPPLVPTPPDFRETSSLRLRIEAALNSNPASALAMRSLMALHSDHDVAVDILYFTYIVADMQHRAGANPFDNRNFLYSGASPTSTVTDNALNDGVHRYAADPRARDYLLRHYTPSGRLAHPMLALHTIYDPRVPTASLFAYAELVAAAGFAPNLIQQYVHREGHCTFSPDEIGRTFDELILWIHTGRHPTPGPLPPQPPH